MAGAASIWGRPLLYLSVLLSAELRSYGLAAATDRLVISVGTTTLKSGNNVSPSEWPLAAISRGPAVAGAISFITEKFCSGDRTFMECLEKLPLVRVAKIVDQAAVHKSDSSLAAVLESFANPIVWQRLLGVQKDDDDRSMGCDKLVTETCVGQCYEESWNGPGNLDGCVLLCTIKHDQCERHIATLDIEKARQGQLETVRQELSSCKEDLGSAKQQIGNTTVAIASMEEATQRELASCRRHAAIAEGESTQERLQRTHDNKECRLNLAHKTAEITSLKRTIKQESTRCRINVAVVDAKAKKKDLQHTVDNDDCRWEMKRQRKGHKRKVSRATSEFEQELWRLKSEWITDLADYEEEVASLKTRARALFVLSSGLTIVVVGFCFTLFGRENLPSSSPNESYHMNNEPRTEQEGFHRSPNRTLQNPDSPDRSLRGMINPLQLSASDQGLQRSGLGAPRSPAPQPARCAGSSKPSRTSSDWLERLTGSAFPVSDTDVEQPVAVVPQRIQVTTNTKQENAVDRWNLYCRLEEHGLEFLVAASDYTNRLLFGHHFKMENRIGAGSFGEINVLTVINDDWRKRLEDYLGHDRGLVMKRLLGNNPTARARDGMSREIEIARSFPPGGHPNIVRHVSSNMTLGTIAMEAMAFDCLHLLRDHEKRFTASSGEMHRIVVGAAYGLSSLHANGIIHGDVKPHNVLLSEDLTEVKLSDWGLSGRSGEEGPVSVTSPYAAPEAIKACLFPQSPPLAWLDPSQDVYSFGLFYWQVVNKMGYLPTSYLELIKHKRSPFVNQSAFARARRNVHHCQEENKRDAWSEGVRNARVTERNLWETYEGTRVKMSIPVSEDLLAVDRCPQQQNLQHPQEVKKFVSAMLHPEPKLRPSMTSILGVLAYPELSARIYDPPVNLSDSLRSVLDTLVVAGIGTTDNGNEWWTKAPRVSLPTRV